MEELEARLTGPAAEDPTPGRSLTFDEWANSSCREAA